MEICTVGSVRGESIGKHAGAFSYSEARIRMRKGQFRTRSAMTTPITEGST